MGRVRKYLQLLLAAALIAIPLKTFVVEAFRIPTRSMENTLLAGDLILVNKILYGATSPQKIPFTDIGIPYFQLPRFSAPARGDILAFTLPWRTPGQGRPGAYVKRCVGLPGDTVSLSGGVVYVNSVRMSPEKARESSSRDEHFGPVIVPQKGDRVPLDSVGYDRWHVLIEREDHEVFVSEGRILIDGNPETAYNIVHDYYFMMGDNRDNSVDSRSWGFVRDDEIMGKAFLIYWSIDEDSGGGGFVDQLTNVRWSRVGAVLR